MPPFEQPAAATHFGVWWSVTLIHCWSNKMNESETRTKILLRVILFFSFSRKCASRRETSLKQIAITSKRYPLVYFPTGYALLGRKEHTIQMVCKAEKSVWQVCLKVIILTAPIFSWTDPIYNFRTQHWFPFTFQKQFSKMKSLRYLKWFLV